MAYLVYRPVYPALICMPKVIVETSSLWADFVNKNSVTLVSEEDKSI